MNSNNQTVSTGIKATVIADSKNQYGTRITTFELEYPRFIHSEFMTHRMLSRNSSSSRAIPIERMLETIATNPASPVHWGKNQAGMQAKEELTGVELQAAKDLWAEAKRDAISASRSLHQVGAHKQIANRVTEPFQIIKVVCTGTEFQNFFWLRDHPDAQPEILELAKMMREAMNFSTPQQLYPGEWHTPYVASRRNEQTILRYYDDLDNQIPVALALMISASCCAQVSYRRSDTSPEKAEVIFRRLIESEPCHASPVEHQALAFDRSYCISSAPLTWHNGLTHVDRDGNFWSGNFRDFVQYRQLIPNNAKKG